MVNIIDQFGQNAGKIWRTLNSNGALTKKELIKETNLSLRDFYAAIGWLARENKIFQNGELFAIDENEFNNLENNDEINIEKTSSEKIFDTIEAVNNLKDEVHIEETFQEKTQNKIPAFDVELIDEAIINRSVNFEKITNGANIFSPRKGFEMSESAGFDANMVIEKGIKINKDQEENDNTTVMKDEPETSIASKSDELKTNNISQEFNNKNSKNSFLSESIEKINKVSRMTPDHLTFKEKSSLSEEMSPWNLPQLQRGTCDLCGEKIEFEDNLSGLTVGGNFFACEKCCKNFSKEELTSWTKSKMKSPSEVRPIGLWVIQEKNKDKSMLSKK